MVNASALHLHALLLVVNSALVGLNLELLGSGSRQLDVDIFVEDEWQVVDIITLHFFPAVDLHEFLLLRVEVQSVAEEVLEMLVFGEDEEADAEHSVGRGYQVFEVN
jgi:hypothetical protein